jgi:hypothetical protein
VLTAPLVVYFVAVPLLLFPFARSLWLALDCYYDSEGAQVTDPYAPPPSKDAPP